LQWIDNERGKSTLGEAPYMVRRINWNTARLICLVVATLSGAPVCLAHAQTASTAPAAHKKIVHKTAATTTSKPATARTTMARSSHSATRNNAVAARRTIGTTAAVKTLATYHGTARSASRTVLAVRKARRGTYERFTVSSFTDNLTAGDVTAGEDPVVRQAAIEALGNMNGTALAIDPSSGRILAMVNQKLALSSGAEPCSTIKLAVGLAALDEGLVTRDTPVNLGGHYTMTLTKALALSINPYFETLGRMLGFERVKHYANMFGLGELAGYNIAGEQLGVYPDTELPAAQGGVGRMCSFGESISMTPLQLGALVSAMANGGTLYYLQHPQTPDEVAAFEPKVKRLLDIAPLVPEMRDGMEGAVDYGTARSLRVNFHEFPVLGKTGTCSNEGTRFGWFASYAETPTGRIVTVFFIEGGRPSFGPHAAELTGAFYRGLWDRNYFEQKTSQVAGAYPAGQSQ
jgi:penicillin-binding protein 2